MEVDEPKEEAKEQVQDSEATAGSGKETVDLMEKFVNERKEKLGQKRVEGDINTAAAAALAAAAVKAKVSLEPDGLGTIRCLLLNNNASVLQKSILIRFSCSTTSSPLHLFLFIEALGYC